MKNIFCLLFLFIFVLYSTAYAGERPREFQGVPWGTHISKVEGLAPKKEPSFANLPTEIQQRIKEAALKSEERGEKTYLRPADILTVPDGEVKSIEYLFVKDIFTQGIIYYYDYPQLLNFVKIYAHLYGPPDRVEKDETMIKHNWYTEKDDEAEVTLFYNPMVKTGYVSMRWKAFAKKEKGLILGDDSKMETDGKGWILLREDDSGKWFYDSDRLRQSDKDIFQIWVKCNLSIKHQNEWRISLKSKTMPSYEISLEAIKCSSKESRNLQFVILSERGPLKVFQSNKNWEPIAPGSMVEALYNKVCK